MALTPAEKQKRYRQRQRQAEEAAPDLSRDFVTAPLSDFKGEFDYEFEQNFTHIGLDFPDGFFDERAIYDVEYAVGDATLSGQPLLTRMEALAGSFLDGAIELYATINEFKLKEIDARIAEIEAADLSDPAAKAKALEDIVTLKTIKARLDGKTFRRSFAEIRVTGSYSDK